MLELDVGFCEEKELYSCFFFEKNNFFDYIEFVLI